MFHKKQLERIYSRSPRRDNIGFQDCSLMKTNLNNIIKSHMFKDQEKSIIVHKHNDLLHQRINQIQNRKNVR